MLHVNVGKGWKLIHCRGCTRDLLGDPRTRPTQNIGCQAGRQQGHYITVGDPTRNLSVPGSASPLAVQPAR